MVLRGGSKEGGNGKPHLLLWLARVYINIMKQVREMVVKFTINTTVQMWTNGWDIVRTSDTGQRIASWRSLVWMIVIYYNCVIVRDCILLISSKPLQAQCEMHYLLQIFPISSWKYGCHFYRSWGQPCLNSCTLPAPEEIFELILNIIIVI